MITLKFKPLSTLWRQQTGQLLGSYKANRIIWIWFKNNKIITFIRDSDKKSKRLVRNRFCSLFCTRVWYILNSIIISALQALVPSNSSTYLKHSNKSISRDSFYTCSYQISKRGVYTHFSLSFFVSCDGLLYQVPHKNFSIPTWNKNFNLVKTHSHFHRHCSYMFTVGDNFLNFLRICGTLSKVIQHTSYSLIHSFSCEWPSTLFNLSLTEYSITFVLTPYFHAEHRCIKVQHWNDWRSVYIKQHIGIKATTPCFLFSRFQELFQWINA